MSSLVDQVFRAVGSINLRDQVFLVLLVSAPPFITSCLGPLVRDAATLYLEERRARYPPTPLPQVVTFDADAERLLREVTTTAASFIDLLTSRPHPFDPPHRPYGRQEARASSSATPHTGPRPEPVPAAQPAIPRLP
ncbi:hypothetical protein DIZ76_014661 [Coccidioides immitis]|nr:hypothetical protein DIZ76_014661 [Coccidioides immitis]